MGDLVYAGVRAGAANLPFDKTLVRLGLHEFAVPTTARRARTLFQAAAVSAPIRRYSRSRQRLTRPRAFRAGGPQSPASHLMAKPTAVGVPAMEVTVIGAAAHALYITSRAVTTCATYGDRVLRPQSTNAPIASAGSRTANVTSK
jgi:hypothetical protein